MSGQYPSSVEVRDWAMSVNPRAVSAAGRLPRDVIAGWNKAHPDRPHVHAQAHHGTPAGYFVRGCRCDRCRAAGSARGKANYEHSRMFGEAAS